MFLQVFDCPQELVISGLMSFLGVGISSTRSFPGGVGMSRGVGMSKGVGMSRGVITPCVCG